MKTITYNPENYTGELAKVAISAEKFEDSLLGWGTHTYKRLDDRVEEIRIVVDGVDFRAVRIDGDLWESESQGIYRSAVNGIVACLRVARNTM